MRKILLAGVGIIISAGAAYAACIPTPSCSSLGYESSSSCEGGIKCPFGNAWNCTLADKITEITTEITEIKKVIEEGGVGGDNKNCQIGNIYYSDKTCSVSYDASKTPIGVVVYIDGQGHGQAMALNSIGNYTWGLDYVDIPTLTNFGTPKSASYDLNSCPNTEKILAAGDKSSYPAAWAAHEYKTEGTEAGDWCLPAAGIITSIYNNMKLVNIGYGLVRGTNIETNSDIWSSSEDSTRRALHSRFSNDYGLYYDNNNGDYYSKPYSNDVRPVLEF